MAGSSLKIENLTIGDNAALPAAAASSEKIPEVNYQSKRGYGVIMLDAWNMRSRKRPKKNREAAKTVSNSSAPVIRKKCVWNPELLKGIDPWRLRKTESHSVPVVVDKDPTSEIPETDMKKFLVLKNSTLGEFVDFVRMRIIMSRKKPMFVYFKNTKPSIDALMCAIDEQNMDEEDGFLHMVYSGEERREVCGSNEEQKCLEPVMFRARI